MIDFDVNLSVSGGSVSGNSFVGTSGINFSFTVSGTYSHPNVTLNMASQGFESMAFTGTIDGDEMNGLVNGSGFVNVPVMLVRQ